MTEGLLSILPIKKGFGAIYSLKKLTFFAPWVWIVLFSEVSSIEDNLSTIIILSPIAATIQGFARV